MHDRVWRVVERAKHAGHVPQGGTHLPSLGEGSGGLPLEVEHVPTHLPSHDLAEVVVAVEPDGETGVAHGPQVVEDPAHTRTGHPLGRRDDVQLVLDGPRPLVGLGGVPSERLGQSDVKLGRHLPETPGLVSEVAAGRLGSRVGVGGVEVSQRGEGQRPPLAASGEELLDQGEVPRVAAPDRHGGGDVVEPHLVEGEGDLDVGIGAWLEATEQLHDQPVVVDHGGVGLLGSHGPHAGGLLTATGHDLEQQQRQLGVGQCAVSQGVPVGFFEWAEDGVLLSAEEAEGLLFLSHTHEHV